MREPSTGRSLSRASSSEGDHSPGGVTGPGIAGFDILTFKASVHAGRMISLAAPSEEDARAWVDAIQEAKEASLKRKQAAEHRPVHHFLERCRNFYDGNTVQFSVALLIITNFIANVIEAEMCPQVGKLAGVAERDGGRGEVEGERCFVFM